MVLSIMEATLSRGPKRGRREVSNETVPYVSYINGTRYVLGHAVISPRAFPEDQITKSPEGEDEISINKIHDDPTYNRTKGPEGQEVGLLGYQCGSHCGVVMAGSHQMVGHCPCVDCHNTKES